jgi:hypothetical protein
VAAHAGSSASSAAASTGSGPRCRGARGALQHATWCWQAAPARPVSTAADAPADTPAVPCFALLCPAVVAAAEHFLAHGDCLMQAVRTVFNIAIGADSPDIQNTARSALLQMVNTVLKRVGQQVMVSAELNAAVDRVCCGQGVLRGGSAAVCGARLPVGTGQGCSHSRGRWIAGCLLCCALVYLASRVSACLACLPACLQSPNGTPLPSPAGTLFRPWGSTSGAMSAAAAAAMAVVGADRRGSSSVPVMGPGAPSASASSSLQEEGRSYSASEAGLGSQALPSPADSGLLMALSQEMAVTSPLAASGPSADMAEAADMAAAAADMAELQATLPRIHTSPPTPTSLAAAPQAGVGVVLDAAAAAVAGAAGGPPLPPGGAAAASAEQFVAAAVEADARTAQLASMAEQSDLRGLERALDSLPQGGEPGSLPPVAGSRAALALARQDTPPDPRRCARGWHSRAQQAGGDCLPGDCQPCLVPCQPAPGPTAIGARPCLDTASLAVWTAIKSTTIVSSVVPWPALARRLPGGWWRRSLMKDRRAAAWRMLTPAEKDALIVLTAMCKVGRWAAAAVCVRNDV